MSRVEVLNHCREIDRCNQRGGRMLSIFDLIERNTMNVELSVFSLYWISQGSSFLVGANPGGAGKTTVMGALLNLVPADVELLPATESIVAEALNRKYHKRCCFVCHEVGSGHWYAYLWGESLRNYFRLFELGHILATNLHADDIDEAYYQICTENRVPKTHFRKINLMYFIKILPGHRRIINKVYLSDGVNEHRLVYDYEDGINDLILTIDNDKYFAECKKFISENIEKIRTIEETRQAVLEFLGGR
ncbi:MAG: hypothetical protein N3G21_08525 [Candidatus Hydrogenedentes bacterium]|nr:hypothetical protein [Candidatus Hydrogenedentota bacterium]